MQRIPEPELMNDPAQVQAYATADFEQPHSRFIELFQQRFGKDIQGSVLDLGCGPCDISLRFARAFQDCVIDAVDGAANMLSYARRLIRENHLQHRIHLIEGRLPDRLPQKPYDIIISNSLLHHMEDPMVLWHATHQYSHSDTRVFIMDLMRPDNRVQAEELLQTYAADEPDILKHDFYHSLLASYRPEEVEQQLQQAGLGMLKTEVVSDRHFIVFGEMS